MDLNSLLSMKPILMVIFAVGGAAVTFKLHGKKISNLENDNRNSRDRLTKLETESSNTIKALDALSEEFGALRREIHQLILIMKGKG